MLTHPQFAALLRARRAHSTLDAIGRELGVSRQAVHAWLRGAATPSHTVLLLAELVWSGAVEVVAGLPIGGESAEDSRLIRGGLAASQDGWDRPEKAKKMRSALVVR